MMGPRKPWQARAICIPRNALEQGLKPNASFFASLQPKPPKSLSALFLGFLEEEEEEEDMEDDEDEFGDLYTDVLRPSSSSQSAPPFSQNSHFAPDDDGDGDDDDILYAPKHHPPNLPLPSQSSPPTSALAGPSTATQQLPIQRSPFHLEDTLRVSNSPISDSSPDVGIRVSGQAAAGGRPSASVDEQENAAVGVSKTASVDLALGRDGSTGASAQEMDAGIGDLDADAVIPGLSTGLPGIPGISQGGAGNEDVGDSLRKGGGADGGGEEDWESDDSDDDLRIVLNEHSGPMAMERNEDEDEDVEDLVIVADGDQNRPEMEDQDWGEEAGQAVADGERKEAGDVVKANGGVTVTGGVGARIGYSGHGYHPHHSQFKVSSLVKRSEIMGILVFVLLFPVGWE